MTIAAGRAGAVLRWGLSFGLLAVVGAQLAGRWESLASQVKAFEPGWFVASLVLLAAYFVLGAEAWRRLLGALGAPIPWRTAFHTLYYANVAKYLPGSVWGLVGRVVLCQRVGVPAAVASAALVMDALCQVVAGVLVGLVALPVFSTTALFGDYALYGVAALVLALVGGMHPGLLNALLGAAEEGLARLGRKRALPRVPYRYGFVLAILALYTLNWALLGAGFALLGEALSPTPLGPSQVLLLAGAFTIAWNVGVFALFAPAGLGVREAAIVLMLDAHFPGGWPALLALAGRAWIVLGEGLAFAAALALAPPQRAPEPAEGPEAPAAATRS